MLAMNAAMKRIIYGNIVILALAAASIGAASMFLFRGAEIYPSVCIGEINVELLTKQEALEKIQNYLETKKDDPIVVLRIDGDEWPIYAADLNMTYDIRRSIDNAYMVAREGFPLQRIRQRYYVMQHGKTLPLEVQYDANKLNALVDNIIAKYNRQPVNASLTMTNGGLNVVEHQYGRLINKAQLIDRIIQSMQTGRGHMFEISVESATPEILTQHVQSISQEWASYVTEFDSSNLDRTENIIIAARAINGTIIKPNGIFSFNQVVGTRAREKGYKNAPVYIQGQLVLDAGGGVCQVSSTLFNAVLLANLEIVERTSHYRPPLYVPLGLDATVADDALDFQFKNNTGSYLLILSEVSGNRIHVRIFGDELKNRPDVTIQTVDTEVLDAGTVIKQDPNLPLGQQVVDQQGQKGYRVTTIRVVSLPGKEVKREIISQDEFTPVEQIIRVGTKVVSTPASPPAQTK